MNSNKRRLELEWKILLPIFLAALVIRIATVLALSHHYIHSDTMAYWENAQSLASGGLPKPIVPRWAVQIGFAWILTPFAACGLSLSFVGHIVMPVIGAGVAVMAALVAAQLGTVRAGVWAGWICALHPTLVNFSSQIVTEQPTALLLLLSLYFMNKRSPTGSLVAGLCWGFTCSMRSPCLGSLVMVGCAWLLLLRPNRYHIAMACGGVLLVLSVCILQLSLAYGHFVFLTPQTDQLTITAPTPGGIRWLDESEVARRGTYLTFAKTHPAEFLAERWTSFTSFVSPWPPGDDRGVVRKAVMASLETPFMIGTLAILALGWWRRARIECLFLPIAWVGLCMFHTLTYSLVRYRVPVLPLLIVFVVVAWFARKNLPDKNSAAGNGTPVL